MDSQNLRETEESVIDNYRGKNFSISPKEMMLKYLHYLPWVIACVILALVLAFLNLRYSPEIFRTSGTMLVKNADDMSGSAERFDEMIFSSNNKNLEDEIQIVRSRHIAKRVINSLGLNVQYYNEGKIRSTQLTASESPFRLVVLSLPDTSQSFSFTVKIVNEKQFRLTEKGPDIYWGQSFSSNNGTFALERRTTDYAQYSSDLFSVLYTPTDEMAEWLVGGFGASQSGESTSIMEVSYESTNPRLGAAIVNQWMKEYQQAGLEEKKQMAVNALNFIDDQMDTVRKELGQVEKNLLNFREKNNIISPEHQNDKIFQNLSEYEKNQIDQNIKIEIVDNLSSYIRDTKNPYRQVASTLGIEEPSLNAQINDFNRLQVQRETMLKTVPRTNPLIVNMETAIEKLRLDILENLKNIRSGIQVSLDDIVGRTKKYNSEIIRIPAKEKELLDISRRQKILEDLYSLLLQKKLETSITAASTISNVRVIEPSLPTATPIKPNRRSTYLIAFFLGVAIPASIIFLKEYLNDKVRSRDDVYRATAAPLMGEVGHSDSDNTLVVTKTSRKFIAEQFRIIRTNLQYVLKKSEKSVILVTSTISGEGKSFISTNIGAVMALAGKKTIIVELDIRKPKIMKGLKLDAKKGLTNYIIGNSAFEDLVLSVPGNENLYVLPSGPVPPNPSELLLDEKLAELIERLKESYDVVIIDTAPVGLVSDPVLLSRFADICLYVVRQNYTAKKHLEMVDDLYKNKRIPRIGIIVNDVKANGEYGYYYGYSTYGYGNEYFEEGTVKMNFVKKLKGYFGRK